jgi:hypothetical protein
VQTAHKLFKCPAMDGQTSFYFKRISTRRSMPPHFFFPRAISYKFPSHFNSIFIFSPLLPRTGHRGTSLEIQCLWNGFDRGSKTSSLSQFSSRLSMILFILLTFFTKPSISFFSFSIFYLQIHSLISALSFPLPHLPFICSVHYGPRVT